MKILIGYDGSEPADAALHDLRRAGLPEQGEVVILSVADVWPHFTNALAEPALAETSAVREGHAVLRRELRHAQELAERAAERVRADLPRWSVASHAAVPDWNITAEARADSPHGAIIKKAEDWKADLIVVGSHGRTAFGRMLLGSVSQSVLTHAHGSVRIGRASPRPAHEPVKIVIGLDGSVEAGAAVAAVCARSWPVGSEAKVVVAVDSAIATALPVKDGEEIYSPRYDSAREWLLDVAENAAGELRAHGLVASPLLGEGSAKSVLVREAEKWEADCIFVGAKGISRLDRFLLGSVSASVAARARCSVEVIRRAN